MDERKRAAWDSVQRSFRFSPHPERWSEILTTVVGLYGLFVGVPAAAGIWAALKIWHRL